MDLAIDKNWKSRHREHKKLLLTYLHHISAIAGNFGQFWMNGRTQTFNLTIVSSCFFTCEKLLRLLHTILWTTPILFFRPYDEFLICVNQSTYIIRVTKILSFFIPYASRFQKFLILRVEIFRILRISEGKETV